MKEGVKQHPWEQYLWDSEGRGTGQREKLNSTVVVTQASANPTEISRTEIAPQRCIKLRQEVQALVSLISLSVDVAALGPTRGMLVGEQLCLADRLGCVTH